MKLLQKQGYETTYLREQDLNANYLPTESISIPVDKKSVIKNNIVDSSLEDQIVDEIVIKIKGQALYKNRSVSYTHLTLPTNREV